ncbi:hypothetical protein [Paraburkholderia kururiensis]|uniref:hypothetical protein n=1 Tax=Paraburkholderia kururiensis TaxID=984307 RepID=UPI000AF8EBA6|nr:hypothetical protein [Paraburkholderia kururiensis]
MLGYGSGRRVEGRGDGAFFTGLPAWVLAFRDRNDEARIVMDLTEAGCVVVCFASKVDALIAATCLRRMGRYCTVLPAGTIPAQQFRDADGRGLVADVHLGWATCGGRLLIRRDGMPARLGRVMHHWAQEPFRCKQPTMTVLKDCR